MADWDIKQEQSVACKVPCVKIDDQYLLSNRNNKSLLLLNNTGTLIWDLYRQGRSISDITCHIREQFDIAQKQAIVDIEQFLQQCRIQSLFQPISDKQNAKTWGEKIRSDGVDVFKAREGEITGSYQIADKRFDIIYSKQAMVDMVHPLFSHLECQSRSPQLSFRLTKLNSHYSIELDDSDSLATRVASMDELIESIQLKVTDLCYRGGDWLTVLHASAVKGVDDSAIVFVAPKGSGKSTLTALLQKYGFVYLSDDVVPITDDGDLCPIPLCQRLKGHSWKLIEDQVQGRLSGTYARSQGEEVRYLQPVTGNQQHWWQKWKVDALVYPRYQKSVTASEIKQLSLFEQVERLCASDSVFGGYIDQSRLQVLVDWLQATPGFELNYSRIDDQLVDLIRERIS